MCVLFSWLLGSLPSCRDEFSIVKRAGNSCSPVLGIFLADAISCVGMYCLLARKSLVNRGYAWHISADVAYWRRDTAPWEMKEVLLLLYLAVAIPSAARQLRMFNCRGACYASQVGMSA